jgi:hypothetical protein
MTDENDLPELPYDGTSGWSGSDTSRERAEHDDTTGITTQRQRMVMASLERVRSTGLTWKELADFTGWHHGQASGALSTLHKTGHIERLAERRDRCHPYVLPEHVDGRDTQPHGGKPGVNPASIWQAGFYAGVIFEAEGQEEYPPNPYD